MLRVPPQRCIKVDSRIVPSPNSPSEFAVTCLDSTMPFNGDPFSLYGKLIVEEEDALLYRKLHEAGIRIKPRSDHSDLLDISDDKLKLVIEKKVGILGAGIAGLYTALILDSLDIEYEILEASDRVGGRLKTHRFVDGGDYDYYEEGAMRFRLPKRDDDDKYKNGPMKRLANLIEYEPLNQGPNPLSAKLVDYHYSTTETSSPGFHYINGIRHPVGPTTEPSGFKAKDFGVDLAYVQAGTSAIYNDVISPFVKVLIKDLQSGKKDGWALLREYDSYSIRGYMVSQYRPSDSLNLPPRPLPNQVVDWCNLVQGSSGGFNRSLTEAVFSDLAFDNQEFGEFEWKCFEGGTETLSNKIKEYLISKNSRIEFGKRVTAIKRESRDFIIPGKYAGKELPATARQTTTSSGKVRVDVPGEPARAEIDVLSYPSVEVTVNNSETRRYGHVISTLPLTVLRTIDLKDAGLNVLQKNALRALDYGPAMKIAVRFKSAWWTEKLNITGGQSFTDLPIRTIVYPSYGEPENPSKVLIASYTWTTDASRLGALAAKENKEILRDLVLRNLAEAHNGYNGIEITYEYLVEQLADGENFHVKDWNTDEYAMGAFPYFSPGEFGKLYYSLHLPAGNGCLHFAGDAVSIRHGWVVGALDSGWKAVYEYLKLSKQTEKLEKFKDLWGGNSEWTSSSSVLEEDSDHDLLDELIVLLRNALQSGLLYA